MNNKMQNDSLISTAERTLKLVELFLNHPEGLTPQEILPHLGISRGALFLLLRTLKNAGYLEQSERRGRYRAGPRLTAWRTTSSEFHQNLMDAFYQEARLHPLSETLLITVPAAQGILTLAQVESHHTVRSAYPIGEVIQTRNPAEDLFQSPPSSSIVQNGYSMQLSSETIELALPVCADGIHPQAALLLSAPSFRWKEEDLIQHTLPELRALAARLSYRLGATTYTPYQVQPPGQLTAEAPLNPQEIRRFLQGPWTARLACLRPDGKPHVIPVWQEWDGKAFYLIAWRGSLWAEYLLQNPEASLTIDEPWPPLRRVSARGKAIPLPLGQDNPQLNELLRRLSERYLGEATLAPSSEQIQQVFQIIPETLRGWKGLLTAHSLKGEGIISS
ncbi:MAG: hypothetical protein KatS3mg047_0172 [Bellilinea sp.]|nr:MAG: hypothetical protein KatS3mg047_0172 [Bellilinea sp.]